MSKLSPYNSVPWYSMNSDTNSKGKKNTLSNTQKCQQIDKHSEFDDNAMMCVCKKNKETGERPNPVKDLETGKTMCPEPFINFPGYSQLNNNLVYFLLLVLFLVSCVGLFNVNVKKMLRLK